MKVVGREMVVTLPIYGRETVFKEKDLISILERHFSSEEAFKMRKTTAKGVTAPVEGYWFDVHPYEIDRKIFQYRRSDENQEKLRRLILEAFAEADKNPEKYGRSFRTMMPDKRWNYMSVPQLKKIACQLGDHNADWVEQAFEWAQRICNGESWITICNNADTAECSRLVVWKSGKERLIGGSRNNGQYYPASYVRDKDFDYGPGTVLSDTVPLVVLYREVEEIPYKELHEYEVVQVPTAGKLFEVNPLGIDRSLFEEPTTSRDWTLERELREKILKAFEEVDKHPEKYATKFYTLIPEKTWRSYKSVEELRTYADNLGGTVADYVEQALEWAQRISNGESWDDICIKTDTSRWYRMYIRADGYAELVGGSRDDNYSLSVSGVRRSMFPSNELLSHTVPLVVFKEN